MRNLLALATILIVCGCTQQGSICEKPYMPNDGACCLDSDGNGACDTAATGESPTTTSTQATTETTGKVITIEQTSTTQPTPPPDNTTSQVTPPTQPKPACSVNADCGQPRISETFCDGNTVKSGVETPSCRIPATALSRCEFRRTTRVEATCEAYCFRGACYPATCYNGVKDYDEEAIDCGLICPPCDQVNVKHCLKDSDCGLDEYKPSFQCYNGAVSREVMRHACVNLTCANSTERSVVELCARNATCKDGRDKCVPGGGTCSDCIMNQNEEGVDCGGFCSRCAPPPGNYSTPHSNVNMSGFNYSTTLGDWGFKYKEPIIEGNCILGARFTIRRPGNYPAEFSVTRKRNSLLDGRAMGFYHADDKTASIWILDETG
jgi:hypothetical protein